jgi:hypothetical protein
MILNEGGNVFADAIPFDHALIGKIKQEIDKVLKQTGSDAKPIGSGATPTPGKKSGDLDVIVDAGALQDYFKTNDAKETRKALRAVFDKAGFDTAQSGQSVHVRVPIEGGSAQVDVMVVPDAGIAAGFHTHNIPKDSKYKGKHKQIAMSYIAKEKGYKWSAFKGLLDRETNELVSNDINEIAKLLLGDGATAKDLGSIESIMSKLPDGGKQMMADLEGDKQFNPQPKESLADKQLRRIKELIQ